MDLTLNELEQAINYWRRMRPSTGEEHALSAEVNALADVYALMIFERARTRPLSSLGDEARFATNTDGSLCATQRTC